MPSVVREEKSYKQLEKFHAKPFKSLGFWGRGLSPDSVVKKWDFLLRQFICFVSRTTNLIFTFLEKGFLSSCKKSTQRTYLQILEVFRNQMPSRSYKALRGNPIGSWAPTLPSRKTLQIIIPCTRAEAAALLW